MLLIFRLMTQKYQKFDSDLQLYDSLDTTTTILTPETTETAPLDTTNTVFSTQKSKPAPEVTTKKSSGLLKGYYKKLTIYLGYFSPLSFIWCCFRKGGTTMQKKVKKIKVIRSILKEKFDMRKIIVDMASLIYNQRNILKELKMTPPPHNFMKEWLNEPGEDKGKEESSQN